MTDGIAAQAAPSCTELLFSSSCPFPDGDGDNGGMLQLKLVIYIDKAGRIQTSYDFLRSLRGTPYDSMAGVL